MNIDHKLGYDIKKSTEEIFDQGVLSVYAPFACPVRCPGCPSMDRLIYHKNPLGVFSAHISWYIRSLGYDAETVLLTGADPAEAMSTDKIKRMSRDISNVEGQRFIIETCGQSHTNSLVALAGAIDRPGCGVVRMRILGSLEWYDSTLKQAFSQFSAMDDSEIATLVANRIQAICSNVETLHSGDSFIHRWDVGYEFITYLRPDMTLTELDSMAQQFKLRGHTHWILEPFVDCSNPEELAITRVSNLDEVLKITGATYRESRYSKDCTKEIIVTLKGDILCANVTENVTNQSNSTATTEPSRSSSEEATSQQDSTSAAANTQS